MFTWTPSQRFAYPSFMADRSLTDKARLINNRSVTVTAETQSRRLPPRSESEKVTVAAGTVFSYSSAFAPVG